MSHFPIAIIGMACRFPQSDGVAAFWRNLLDERDCVGTVPPERWDAQRFAGQAPGAAGLTYCPRAGMDPDGDCYDAAFFGLDAEEARRMDPQQGVLLELAWHACEDANVVPAALSGRDVGVYVGISTRDFDRRIATLWRDLDVRITTGACGAVAANRVSYVFGLAGPSVAVDVACTSSLAAVHMACRALADGECSLAFAGGVHLMLAPTNMVAISQGGLLARDGRCKPFAAGADGYVFGEGAGLLLLKPLAAAVRDGDPIRAVIRGSAINHNGRSNGIAAPYRPGVAQVMRKALERADVDPASIAYVEAHATGTPIGDAIEFQAIRDVYGAARKSPCYVGSVKSNIGHLEAAAGIAALAKAVLAVEQGVLPATLSCAPPHPMLRAHEGDVRLCEATRDWPAGAPGPRRAAASASSFGGGNAHVVIEQAPAVAQAPRRSGPSLLLVSARSAAAFERLCASYAEALAAAEKTGAPLHALSDFCRATQIGRQHHAVRGAWVVADWAEAIAALRGAQPVFCTPRGHGTADGTLPAQSLHHAAELYCHGIAPSGDVLGAAGQVPAQRAVRLPLYPFERRRNHVIHDDLTPAGVAVDPVSLEQP